MSCLLPDLCIGITSALFKESGNTPSKIHLLKISVIKGLIILTLSFKNLIFVKP